MKTAWPTEPLGSLCDIQIGRTPPRSQREYWGGEFPWLSISDMNQGRNISSTTERITEAAVRTLNCRPVQPGTVLLSFKLSIGKVGIATAPLFTNEAIAHLPIIDDRLDRDYLYWALKSIPLTEGADRAAMGATLNKAKLQLLQIPMPPLEEQRRIASILDAADALRTKRHHALEKLDTLTQSIFMDMFGELAEDPACWIPLADLIREDDRINYGVVQPGDDAPGGVPMIRVGDLVDGCVEHRAIKHIAREIDAQYDRSRLVGDEILLSCVGSAGVVALATPKEAGWNIARAVARIPLAETVEREFVAAFLSSEIAQRYFANELRTVSQPTLNIKQIKETPVPVPKRTQQAEFGRRAREVRQLRNRYRFHHEQMDALFASLQHRAFRGEL